jgi:hypothetical protein
MPAPMKDFGSSCQEECILDIDRMSRYLLALPRHFGGGESLAVRARFLVWSCCYASIPAWFSAGCFSAHRPLPR